MLSEKRSVYMNGGEIVNTPLLVPSFSSKAIHQVTNYQKLFTVMEEVITGPILISAYDIYYEYVKLPIAFPELIFIDSGGYESAKDSEFSDLGYTVHEPKEWDLKRHIQVLDQWDSEIPSVIISYDHPKTRIPLKKQIKNADALFSDRDGFIKEILIKPETPDQHLLKIDSIIRNASSLAKFDIIGFTEKELGNSTFNRMFNIARIRRALNKIKSRIPIHIFGNLDPLTTPLYYLAGADIFDGLSWLRYSFVNGYTVQKLSGGTYKYDIKTRDTLVEGRILYDNMYELEQLTHSMRRFLLEQKFDAFKYHGDFFQRSFELLMEELKEA